MKRLRLKEFAGKLGFKQWLLLGLNLVLVLACALSALGLHRVSNTLDTSAAQRFRGESETRFAQLACYLPVGRGKTVEDILSFRQGLDSKFVEQSLEAPENGSLFADAYSGSAKVSVTTEHGSAELSAFGVGGDFFYFHPLRLRSGAYISERDLMDDLVVLDEVMAWRLFGGVDLTGLTLYINGEPFLVSGVAALEDDFASSRAYTQEGSLFMSYSALKKLNEALSIDCYEIVLPDPITGYAYSVVEEGFGMAADIVENSSRYSLGRLLDVIGSFGERSMRTNGVIYPYWENALRLTEDYAALLLILTAAFALCPLVCAAVWVIRGIRRGYRLVKAVIPRKVEETVERRREQRLERELDKRSEGE